MKKALLLIFLPLVAADLYKETQNFEYSRTSGDEKKEGFYGAQSGNMGGNFEVSHNMDGLAQNQMKGLMVLTGSQLGIDPHNMGKGLQTPGSVYGSASARGSSLTGSSLGSGVGQSEYNAAYGRNTGARYGDLGLAEASRLQGGSVGYNGGSRQHAGGTYSSTRSRYHGTTSSNSYGGVNENIDGAGDLQGQLLVPVQGVSGDSVGSDSHTLSGSRYRAGSTSSSTNYGGVNEDVHDVGQRYVPVSVRTSETDTQGGTRYHAGYDRVVRPIPTRVQTVGSGSVTGRSSVSGSRYLTTADQTQNEYDEGQRTVDVNQPIAVHTIPSRTHSGSTVSSSRYHATSDLTQSEYDDGQRVVAVDQPISVRPGNTVRLVVRPGTPLTVNVPVSATRVASRDQQESAASYGHSGTYSTNIESASSTRESQGQARLDLNSGRIGGAGNYRTSQYYDEENGQRPISVNTNPVGVTTMHQDFGAVAQNRDKFVVGGIELAPVRDSPTYSSGSRVATTGRLHGASQTHHREVEDEQRVSSYRGEEGERRAGQSAYDIASNVDAASAGHNQQSQVAGDGKPKTFHSSYSYQKSWEKHGDPYVIQPGGSGALASDSLVRGNSHGETGSADLAQTAQHRGTVYGSQTTTGSSSSNFGSQTRFGNSNSQKAGSEALTAQMAAIQAQLEAQMRNQMSQMCGADCGQDRKTKGYRASYSYSAQRTSGGRDNVQGDDHRRYRRGSYGYRGSRYEPDGSPTGYDYSMSSYPSFYEHDLHHSRMRFDKQMENLAKELERIRQQKYGDLGFGNYNSMEGFGMNSRQHLNNKPYFVQAHGPSFHSVNSAPHTEIPTPIPYNGQHHGEIETFDQETEDLGQQTEDFGKYTTLEQNNHHLGQETLDLGQQTEDLGQQTEDLGQQTEDLGKYIQINHQNSETKPIQAVIEVSSHRSSHNYQMEKKNENLNQQTESLDQHSQGSSWYSTYTSPSSQGKASSQVAEDLGQQTEDLGQISENLEQETQGNIWTNGHFSQDSQTNFEHGDLPVKDRDNVPPMTPESVRLGLQTHINYENNQWKYLDKPSQINKDMGKQTEDLRKQIEDLGQQTEDLGQQTEDLGQQMEDLGQQTEDLGQQTENLGYQPQKPSWSNSHHTVYSPNKPGLTSQSHIGQENSGFTIEHLGQTQHENDEFKFLLQPSLQNNKNREDEDKQSHIMKINKPNSPHKELTNAGIDEKLREMFAYAEENEKDLLKEQKQTEDKYKITDQQKQDSLEPQRIPKKPIVDDKFTGNSYALDTEIDLSVFNTNPKNHIKINEDESTTAKPIDRQRAVEDKIITLEDKPKILLAGSSVAEGNEYSFLDIYHPELTSKPEPTPSPKVISSTTALPKEKFDFQPIETHHTNDEFDDGGQQTQEILWEGQTQDMQHANFQSEDLGQLQVSSWDSHDLNIQHAKQQEDLGQLTQQVEFLDSHNVPYAHAHIKQEEDKGQSVLSVSGYDEQKPSTVFIGNNPDLVKIIKEEVTSTTPTPGLWEKMKTGLGNAKNKAKSWIG